MSTQSVQQFDGFKDIQDGYTVYLAPIHYGIMMDYTLIHWKFVIHACIDGFSRMVASLVCGSDNRVETALKAFLSGVKVLGLPAKVRGDWGTENVATAEYMQAQQGHVYVYIYGPSVHNQRIERLHCDTTHCV